MKGQRIGYVRVSSLDQNEARQLEGIPVDRTFVDKCSGKDTNRPQLQAMLGFAREGDTILVHSLDRLGRSLVDLRTLVTTLTKRGIRVEFIKEALVFTGEDSPIAKMLLSMLGAVAEFERDLIKERQREGIAIAKAKGNVYKGRKPSLSGEQAAELRKRVTAGEPKAALAREFGISRETLYSYLRA
jgi:DNA invertase Pin-like site-specific DNA recombinase